MNPKSNFSSKEFLEKVKADRIEKFQFWRDIQRFYKQNEVEDIKLFVSCLNLTMRAVSFTLGLKNFPRLILK